MGVLLQKGKSDFDSQEEIKYVIHQLKQRNLSQIYECIETIDDQYPTRYKLVYQEFEDIFGWLMDDTEPLFNKLKEFNMVDVYEALGVMVMFCGEEFEKKCGFVFRLFDFDNSFTLEKTELMKTVKVVLRGICKVVGLPLPSQKFSE